MAPNVHAITVPGRQNLAGGVHTVAAVLAVRAAFEEATRTHRQQESETGRRWADSQRLYLFLNFVVLRWEEPIA